MDGITSSPLFETVVGLVVIWFLLSLVVSGVLEFVATITNYRARYLWESIDMLLGGGAPPGNDGASKASLLARPATQPRTSDPVDKVVDLIPGLTKESLKKVRRINPDLLVDAIVDVQAGDPSAFEDTLVGRALNRLPPGLDVESKRQRVESWVDSAMEQMSGAYRSKMRRYAVVFAAVVTLVVGVDSLWAAQHLYGSSTARAAALAFAGSANDGAARYADCLTGDTTTTTAGSTTTTTTEPNPPSTGATATTSNATGSTTSSEAKPDASADDDTTSGGTDASTSRADGRTCASTGLDDLDKLEVRRYRSNGFRPNWLHEPEGWQARLAMVGGLAATAVATSMGAPFWLDVIKRLMGLRKARTGGVS